MTGSVFSPSGAWPFVASLPASHTSTWRGCQTSEPEVLAGTQCSRVTEGFGVCSRPRSLVLSKMPYII